MDRWFIYVYLLHESQVGLFASLNCWAYVSYNNSIHALYKSTNQTGEHQLVNMPFFEFDMS